MSTLSQNYSGIVINNDADYTETFNLTNGTQIAQVFALPPNYVRGTSSNEQYIPDLSGFQILVDVTDDATATLEWSVGFCATANPTTVSQFEILQSGTTTGTYKTGLVWFEVILDEPIPVQATQLSGSWLLLLTVENVNYVTYTVYTASTSSSIATQSYQVAGGDFVYLNNVSGSTLPSTSLEPSNVLAPSGSALNGSPTSFNFRVLGLVADSGTDFLGNPYRSVTVTAPVENVLTTTGGTSTGGVGSYWMSQALPAPDAVASLYFDVRPTAPSGTVQDTPVVIDALVFEPITPNIKFNLYYSSDNSTTDWETKLWSRVPRVFVNPNQTLVLPAPISGKYVKIEMFNPQAQSYDPGDFQIPTEYKTFPSWVQNYFNNQTQYPSYTTDQVIVQSDALTTLYQPNTSDLDESPDVPVGNPQAPQYVAPTGGADLNTLGQINVNPNTYQDPVGTTANNDSVLGQLTTGQLTNTIDGPQQVTEAPPVTYPPITTVSSLQRDSVLAQQLTPDMYFFYTCRHGYQEVTGTFSNNVGYFFGVNSVTFLRAQHNTASDNEIYIETGGDNQNAYLNDFRVNETGYWDAGATPEPVNVEVQGLIYTGSQTAWNTLKILLRQSEDIPTLQNSLNNVLQGTLDGQPQPGIINTGTQNAFVISSELQWGTSSISGSNQKFYQITISNNINPTIYTYNSYISSDVMLNQLTNDTYYIFWVKLVDNSIRVKIFPYTTQGFMGTPVFDSSTIVDANVFFRQPGSVSFQQSLQDNDAQVVSVQNGHTAYAVFESNDLNSITPLWGAQLYSQYTPPSQLFNTQNDSPPWNQLADASGNEPMVTNDTHRTLSGTSTRVDVLASSASPQYQGIQSNALTQIGTTLGITDFANTKFSFEIWPSASAFVGNSQPFTALLVNSAGYGVRLPMPALLPNQWQTVELEVPPSGTVYSQSTNHIITSNPPAYYQVPVGEYTLALLYTGTQVTTFWIDEVNVLFNAVNWYGRAYSNNPFVSSQFGWTPFGPTVNNSNDGIRFTNAQRSLQIKAEALQPTAEIYNGFAIVPVYGQLGKLVWNDNQTYPQVIPTGDITIHVSGSPPTYSLSGTTTWGSPIINWQWSFGDGQYALGSQVSHTYTPVTPNTGTADLTLTIIDINGNIGISSETISI